MFSKKRGAAQSWPKWRSWSKPRDTAQFWAKATQQRTCQRSNKKFCKSQKVFLSLLLRNGLPNATNPGERKAKRPWAWTEDVRQGFTGGNSEVKGNRGDKKHGGRGKIKRTRRRRSRSRRTTRSRRRSKKRRGNKEWSRWKGFVVERSPVLLQPSQLLLNRTTENKLWFGFWQLVDFLEWTVPRIYGSDGSIQNKRHLYQFEAKHMIWIRINQIIIWYWTNTTTVKSWQEQTKEWWYQNTVTLSHFSCNGEILQSVKCIFQSRKLLFALLFYSPIWWMHFPFCFDVFLFLLNSVFFTELVDAFSLLFWCFPFSFEFCFLHPVGEYIFSFVLMFFSLLNSLFFTQLGDAFSLLFWCFFLFWILFSSPSWGCSRSIIISGKRLTSLPLSTNIISCRKICCRKWSLLKRRRATTKVISRQISPLSELSMLGQTHKVRSGQR